MGVNSEVVNSLPTGLGTCGPFVQQGAWLGGGAGASRLPASGISSPVGTWAPCEAHCTSFWKGAKRSYYLMHLEAVPRGTVVGM